MATFGVHVADFALPDFANNSFFSTLDETGNFMGSTPISTDHTMGLILNGGLAKFEKPVPTKATTESALEEGQVLVSIPSMPAATSTTTPNKRKADAHLADTDTPAFKRSDCDDVFGDLFDAPQPSVWTTTLSAADPPDLDYDTDNFDATFSQLFNALPVPLPVPLPTTTVMAPAPSDASRFFGMNAEQAAAFLRSQKQPRPGDAIFIRRVVNVGVLFIGRYNMSDERVARLRMFFKWARGTDAELDRALKRSDAAEPVSAGQFNSAAGLVRSMTGVSRVVQTVTTFLRERVQLVRNYYRLTVNALIAGRLVLNSCAPGCGGLANSEFQQLLATNKHLARGKSLTHMTRAQAATTTPTVALDMLMRAGRSFKHVQYFQNRRVWNSVRFLIQRFRNLLRGRSGCISEFIIGDPALITVNDIMDPNSWTAKCAPHAPMDPSEVYKTAQQMLSFVHHIVDAVPGAGRVADLWTPTPGVRALTPVVCLQTVQAAFKGAKKRTAHGTAQSTYTHGLPMLVIGSKMWSFMRNVVCACELSDADRNAAIATLATACTSVQTLQCLYNETAHRTLNNTDADYFIRVMFGTWVRMNCNLAVDV